MVQGALVGVIGTLGGVLLGLLVAFNIDVIVPAHRARCCTSSFLPTSVYLISRMPSDLQAADIVPIARDLAGARVPRDALPELAREPRQSGRGAAL